MPQFVATMTFGDLLFLLALIFWSGVSYAQLRALAARMTNMEERIVALTADLQRVIVGFEWHVKGEHG